MEIIVNEGVEKKRKALEQQEVNTKGQESIDYELMANSKEFKHLLKVKKKFLVPITAVFMTLYFLLPILTSYTTILNNPAIGSISWTWVYSIGLFVMVWILCIVYVKKAAKFDKMASNLIEKYKDQGEE